MTLALQETTLELRDRLRTAGVPLPFALKRRDPKEPGRRRKEKTEDALFKAFNSYFRMQKRMVRETITAVAPGRKTAFGYDVDYYMNSLPPEFWADDDFVAKIARILGGGASVGVDLFADLIDLEIDYTLVNDAAAKWATKYAGSLVSGIDSTTKDVVRRAISDFVKTPGMTIGDVVNRLPYNDSRALMIATTETTKTYAMAQREAGRQLQKEYPDIEVVKMWYTNNDDRVCPICAPLDGMTILLDDKFPGGIEQPPAHVRCRCWMATTTRIT